MIRLALAVATVFSFLCSASAQVRQSGTVTPRHAACWTTTGVIQDCGTAANGTISSLGTTGEGPTICARSAAGSAYNLFCLSSNTNSAAQLTLQNFGSAAAQTIEFNINGVVSVPVTSSGPFTATHLAAFLNSSGTLVDSGMAVTSGTVTTGVWNGTTIGLAYGGTGATTAAGARTNLGLGSMAIQNANAVAITGGSITGMPNPSANTDVANKAYVDATAQGLKILATSTYATAAVLPNTPTYSNGASGVGATLTAGSNAALVVDGVSVSSANIILVKNQASAFQNGIYTVTTVGDGSNPWVLTRVTYFDQAAEMTAGSYTLVTAGNTNANKSYVLQTTVTTVGTDAVTWIQFSASSGVNSVGGLTGTINLGNGLITSGSSTIVNTWQRTVMDYGAKCDGTKLTSTALSITSGTAALTVTNGTFTADDVGKNIIVPGAGVAGGNLATTITAVGGATSITLNTNASTTLSSAVGVVYYYTTDDATAFNTAFAAGQVVVPPGKNCAVSPGVISFSGNKSVSVTGFGVGTSTVTALGCGNLFSWGGSVNNNTTNYYNLSVETVCAQAASGTAIASTWSGTAFTFRTITRMTVSNVMIQGVDVNTQGFAIGILMTDASGVNITNTSIVGLGTQTATGSQSSLKSSAAILITGNIIPVAFQVSNLWVYNHTRGIYVTGAANSVEGIVVSSSNLVNVLRGIEIDGSTAPGHPFVNVTNTHVACFEICINLLSMSDVSLSDNELYCLDGSQLCKNVVLDGGYNAKVHHNSLYSYSTSFKADGITLTNMSYASVTDNYLACTGALYNTGISIASSNVRPRLRDNTFANTACTFTATITNNAATAIYGSPGAMVQLTSNATIPNGSTTLTFNATAVYDSAGFFNGTTNLTVPAGLGVKQCQVGFGGTWDASASGYRLIQVQKNGSGSYAGFASVTIPVNSASTGTIMSASGMPFPCSEGDTFSLLVVQTSGGNLTLFGGGLTWMSLKTLP